MQRVKCKYRAILPLILMVLISLFSEEISAQDRPPVNQDFQEFFTHYVDKRSRWDKSLNLIGLERKDIGRSFALIAGVSQYPNMPPTKRELKPAALDIEKLQEYLKSYEFYDEIVVLKDGDVNLDNLQFFLQTYFPDRLRKFPNSRFLFAYSGHGMTEYPKGYLLKSSARNHKDKQNSINLRIVRIFVDEVVGAGHQVLVLMNACYSGAFLERSPFGGSRKIIPKNPGAHAITAGGTGEPTWHIPSVGEGSVFFEKIFAGLDGRADTSPEDGIINVLELFTYLKREVQIFTDQEQNPQLGDISKHGSKGEFFFFNRDRQVRKVALPIWNPRMSTPFGENAAAALEKGKDSYSSENYSIALTYFHQAAEAGYGEAMFYLGYMYQHGLGIELDLAKGAVWYRKGADAGDKMAMGYLGLIYESGAGVRKDYNMAAHWLHKAANAGHIESMVLLAQFYRKGLGVSKDYNVAFRWAKSAAEAGDSTGMLMVGIMYESGEGVPKNSIEALRWYRKAALTGNITGVGILERTNYDQIVQNLLEQFKNKNRVEVELTKGQLATLKFILKEHGGYWGQVYLGLCASSVGLVPRDSEESKKRVLNILDATAQVWAGRNVNSRMQGKSAKDAMNEFANIVKTEFTNTNKQGLDDNSVFWIRQKVLNRPELYALDEFPVDGPKLPPLY